MTRWIFAVAGLALAAGLASAQLRATRVATGLSGAFFGTTAPGQPADTMYIVERGGTVRTFNSTTNAVNSTAFFNHASVTGHTLSTAGEGGLLGLAFHPNFATNRTFYTFSTATAGTGNNLRVDQYRTNVNGTVDYSSQTNVITVPHLAATNHNGGWIGFKPGDSGNNLYIGTGDGGGGNDTSNNAQNTNNLLGKMLRLDVGAAGIASPNGYAIPAGNMTVNPNGNLSNPAPPTLTVAPEIFAYGLRNPFRNGFDRGSSTGVGRGNLYIGDVGQDTREEISFIASGRVNSPTLNQSAGSQNGINFGWRLREGSGENPAYPGATLRNDNVEPVFSYVQTVGATPFYGNSVTGGLVYRGPAFADSTGTGGDLNGTYIFADYVNGQVGTMRTDPATGLPIPGTVINRTSELTGNGATIAGIAGFGEDGLGNLFYMNLNNGEMWKFVPVPEPAALLAGGLWLLGFRSRRDRSH